VTSLLPEIHIAVLRAGDIKENLAQVFSDENPYLRKVLDASAVALVTGPSRTADIEMTLTIGVHGPARLIVLVCDSTPQTPREPRP
jgi:L-lactate dehydrogenase complex protein LldG